VTTVGSSSLTLARCQMWGADPGEPAVVWLKGAHDESTISALSLTLARAIALEDDTVVIDLSEVQQLSLATIDVLIRARELRRMRSRTLQLRSPSSSVLRVLVDACAGHEQSAALIQAVVGPEGP